MKILLNKKRSKTSVNKDSKVAVDLGNEMKKISDFSDSHVVDLYQLYLDERDASNKYRLIFTINPVCTNALFNTITEVVYKEGSSECQNLTGDAVFPGASSAISSQPVTRLQAIRDTEYSHPKLGGLTYLPGVDIFNNHLLRQNEFNCVMKRTSSGKGTTGMTYSYNEEDKELTQKASLTDVFNTIRDYQRDMSGNLVKKSFPGSDSTYLNPITGNPHLYQEADIMSFEDAFTSKIKEDNGWFGFYNPATLEIPVKKIDDKDIYINKLLNDRGACDFIDLFPDRSRFSFMPYQNPYRNRMEKNWEYCLTYAYKSTVYEVDDKGLETQELNPIVMGEEDGNGLRFRAVRRYLADSDKERILIQSIDAHHNLDSDSKVVLYYRIGNSVITTSKTIKVRGLGNLDGEFPGHYFSIDASDVPDWLNDETGLQPQIEGRFARIALGSPCKYYFRIHRRLPDYKNEINKLAFASNIYGDNVVQLIYLDDIDLTGIVDNFGRPLTDIYLTIVKSNKGHKEWYYGEGNGCKDDNVTRSRVFGKVTSGIDIPYEPGFSYDFNVRRLHNINLTGVPSSRDYVPDMNVAYDPPKPLEDDIQIDGREFFLGDLVEYSEIQYQETVLEPIYHRFNTAQRECVNFTDRDIIYDEIYMDDYEGSETGKTGSIADNFKCAEEKYNQGKIENSSGRVDYKEYPGNLLPEGYYYKPHYLVHVRDVSNSMSQSSDTQVALKDNKISIELNQTTVSFTTNGDFDLTLNDEIVVQNLDTKEVFEGVVISTIGDNEVTAGTYNKIGTTGDTTRFAVFKKTIGIPAYAARYPDTSGKYIWRTPLLPSQFASDSELYNRPFTNGAHYQHIGINFFLKRQDPYGDYDLNYDGGTLADANKLNNIKVLGAYNDDIYKRFDIINFGLPDIC